MRRNKIKYMRRHFTAVYTLATAATQGCSMCHWDGHRPWKIFKLCLIHAMAWYTFGVFIYVYTVQCCTSACCTAAYIHTYGCQDVYCTAACCCAEGSSMIMYVIWCALTAALWLCSSDCGDCRSTQQALCCVSALIPWLPIVYCFNPISYLYMPVPPRRGQCYIL